MQQSETKSSENITTLSLLKDHLDLVALEWGHEKQEGWRRLLGLSLGVILLFSSFVYLQIAQVAWLLNKGLRWDHVGLIMGLVYLTVGIVIIWVYGQRQKGWGAPFQGSLDELKRSFSWIEKRFL